MHAIDAIITSIWPDGKPIVITMIVAGALAALLLSWLIEDLAGKPPSHPWLE